MASQPHPSSHWADALAQIENSLAEVLNQTTQQPPPQGTPRADSSSLSLPVGEEQLTELQESLTRAEQEAFALDALLDAEMKNLQAWLKEAAIVWKRRPQRPCGERNAEGKNSSSTGTQGEDDPER